MMNLGLMDAAFLGSLTSYDPDAAAYISAVEAADGQALETGVRDAINAFVLGCKADGIWNAIKASCILAGARTLAGALVPLVGAAPTKFNFVPGDYDRKTGLVGNGSTKYLDSNRNNNADPQDNQHVAFFNSTNGSGSRFISALLGSIGGTRVSSNIVTSRGTSAFLIGGLTGFSGISRSASATFLARNGQSTTTFTSTSQSPANGNFFVFANNTGTTADAHSSPRLAFYSIGESLNLALLDARVTALVNALAVAVP